MLRALPTLIVSGAALHCRAQDGYIFTTIAGNAEIAGAVDGTPTDARFSGPRGVAVDLDGTVLVADSGNATIRRISISSVTTVAGRSGQTGTANGSAALARFGATGSRPIGSFTIPGPPPPMKTFVVGPYSLEVDGSGRVIVADTGATTIRTISNNQVATLAGAFQPSFPTYNFSATPPASPITFPPAHLSIDGVGSDARFRSVTDLTIDASGAIYIADTNAHTIRKIVDDVVTTYAGAVGEPGATNGARLSARFNAPAAVTADAEGNLFIADANNYCIRRISAAGEVTTLAGLAGSRGSADATGSQARFGGGIPTEIPADVVAYSPPFVYGPSGVVSVGAGKILVADTSNHTIRMVTHDGAVSTVGGSAGNRGSSDGVMSTARFAAPVGLAVDRAGNIYVADTGNHTIRKGTPAYLPRFARHPTAQRPVAGGTLELTTAVDANALHTSFEWRKDGVAIPGATNPSLIISSVQVNHAGTYEIVATNALGSVASNPAEVRVGTALAIVSAPVAQTLLGGQPFSLSVSATGLAPFTYQWQRNGKSIPGATRSTFDVPAAQAEDGGAYTVVVSSPLGSVTSAPAGVTVNTARIVNLSIRSTLSQSASALTVGFAVSGNDKSILTRAVGPGLRQFGLSTVTVNPRMTLFDGAISLVSNEDWDTSDNASVLAATASNLGAFSLAAGSRDSAVLSSFTRGAYSAQVTGSPATGVVLVELYDGNPLVAARLINVSAKAFVGTGDDVLVAGFVVTGNSKKTLLIRAIGPTLALFGVTHPLADPILEVIEAGRNATIATNDNWGGLDELSATFVSRGAFPLIARDSRDAALLFTIEPGTYSCRVFGEGNATGEALVEIYEID